MKKNVKFDEKVSAFSTRLLYNFSMDQKKLQCSKEICQTYSEFQWYSPYPCNIILVCNHLTGKIFRSILFNIDHPSTPTPPKKRWPYLAS